MNDVYRVLVLDMQPIDPPVGGGRLRILGLYHNLGEDLPTTYIGTYDWRGEYFRDHYLSNTLREIDIPLSEDHFREADALQAKVDGKTIIDSTFHTMAHLSPDFLQRIRAESLQADILFFSHPWIYPLLRDSIDRTRQLVVYDSHNVEGFLRTQLLDDGKVGTDIAKEVVRLEYQLCHESDLVLTCSHEDRELFNTFYYVPFQKMRVVPNGTFVQKILPASEEQKRQAKVQLGAENMFVALFIGSLYAPNLEAAQFICFELAPRFPDILFIICGGVGDGIDRQALHNHNIRNVSLTGVVAETEKLRCFQAADIALNPMNAGSGTNIKMLDFFAAGLPTISTPIGARGLEPPNEQVLCICELPQFAEAVRDLRVNSALRDAMHMHCRRFAEETFAWERISPKLGLLVKRWFCQKHVRPYFSVIVPSYERHDTLTKLMQLLAQQTFKNFEVLIVDQSSELWPGRDLHEELNIFYIHTDIRGPGKARNTALFFARGAIVAFTDDDCEPDSDWLLNAYQHFHADPRIGIEGRIRTEHFGDPNYRTVSNEGFEGIGFMTANLMLYAEIVHRINGFDERFELPFREDTDMAWRALEYGKIPYGQEVCVFHPPHKRNIARESLEERDKFYEKDILLLKKHPEKYRQLFLSELHWKEPGFRKYFREGARKYGIEIPSWCFEYLQKSEKTDIIV